MFRHGVHIDIGSSVSSKASDSALAGEIQTDLLSNGHDNNRLDLGLHSLHLSPAILRIRGLRSRDFRFDVCQ